MNIPFGEGLNLRKTPYGRVAKRQGESRGS